MKWLRFMLVMSVSVGMLVMGGCGDDGSPAGPTIPASEGTWRMVVTEETITDNPFNYCTVTDVGREFLIRIELATPTSFNIAITQGSNVELTGTGNIRGSDYRFTVEGTEIEDGNSYSVKMEGTMRLKSETQAEGTATYEYGEGRGETVLCRGDEKFSGSQTVIR